MMGDAAEVVWIPQPDEIDAEGSALQYLDRLGLSRDGFHHPTIFNSLTGLTPKCGALRGCKGALNRAKREVWIPNRGTDAHILECISHEHGHNAQDMAGAARPHSESQTDDVSGRIWLRPRKIHRMVNAAGWEAPRWMMWLGHTVPALVVFRRVAVETGGIIIARHRGRRWVFARPEYEVPVRPRGWELAWFNELRTAGSVSIRPLLWGIRCQRFVDPGGGAGEVILVPPDAAELAVERPWVFEEAISWGSREK